MGRSWKLLHAPNILGLIFPMGLPRTPVWTGLPAEIQAGEDGVHCTCRPQLEYAAAVWEPNMKDKVQQVEQVQGRAARWVSGNYERLASVSAMIATLEFRARLCLFYRIVYSMVTVPLLDYNQPTTRVSFNDLSTAANHQKILQISFF